MNRLFSTLAVLVLGLSVSGQTSAESTIEVDPQSLRPTSSSASLNYAMRTGDTADNLITPVRRWGWYGRPYYGGYYRPYRSNYYGGGGGYPYRSYSYYRPYYNYGYSSYPNYSYGYGSYPSYGYNSYPRYTTGYRYGINPGVSFSFGW